MHHEILDQADQYHGARTCPACGHQFPFRKFVIRYLMSFGLSTWPCYSCKRLISCDFIKVQFYWLLGLVPFGLFFGVMLTYFELDGILNLLYAVPFLGFVLATLYYVKFELHEA